MSVIAYFDESGDDGLNNYASETFILTSLYMHASNWNENFELLKKFRRHLKEKYGILVKEEFHTAHFFKDKDPYRKYNLTNEQRKEIVILYAKVIATIKGKIVNTIIDKEVVVNSNYPVLSNALTYTIQRIENDSDWRYLIISDKGRISIMKKTARSIRNYNPITSMFNNDNYYNSPIKNMVEDILEKDSKESYFIQICDFVSYIVNLYYKYVVKGKKMPKRIEEWLTTNDIIILMKILKNAFNLNASSSNEYGLVIYPKSTQKKRHHFAPIRSWSGSIVLYQNMNKNSTKIKTKKIPYSIAVE